MRFVLKYFGSGIDGRDSEKCFPVEATSKAEVLSFLREQAYDALLIGFPEFVAFNQTHHTHNFVRQVSPIQAAMFNRRAQQLGVPAPQWLDVRGRLYRFGAVGLQVLSVDEWFAELSAVPEALRETADVNQVEMPG